MRELRNLGLTEKSDGRYHLTTKGKIVKDRIEGLDRATGSNDLIEHAKKSIPEEILFDAEIHPSRTSCPDQPVEALEKHVKDSDSIQGFVPVVLDRYVRFYTRQITAGLEAELIFEHQAYNSLMNNYTEDAETALEHDVTLLTTNQNLDIGLLIVDRNLIGAAIYDDRGSILGTITANTVEALDWANDLYQKQRERADPPKQLEAFES